MAAAIHDSTINQNTNEDSVDIAKPASTITGDLMLVVLAHASGVGGAGNAWNVIDWAGVLDEDVATRAFTEIALIDHTDGSTVGMSLGYRNVTSDDDTSVTYTIAKSGGGESDQVVACLCSIDGHKVQAPTQSNAEGNDTAGYPPNHAAASGLWLAALAVDGGPTITGRPTGYSVAEEDIFTSNVTLSVVAHDTPSQPSPQNPSAFAWSGGIQWVAATINIEDLVAGAAAKNVAICRRRWGY